MRAPPKRAWQRMLSGRRLDLLNPSPLDIEIEDIAHGLARLARWNGQTLGAHVFSVAQHSLLVEDLSVHFRPRLALHWRKAALIHDAPEYVIGDLISPFKSAIGLDYGGFEARLQGAVHQRFGLNAPLPKAVKTLVKRADRCAAFLEAVQIAGFEESEARRLFLPSRNLPDWSLSPLSAEKAERRFLNRFHTLEKARLTAPARLKGKP